MERRSTGKGGMKFTRVQGEYYEKSDCGRYTVAATSNGKDWLFGAWRLGPPHLPLGQFCKAQDARDACEADVALASKAA